MQIKNAFSKNNFVRKINDFKTQTFFRNMMELIARLARSDYSFAKKNRKFTELNEYIGTFIFNDPKTYQKCLFF